MSRDYDRDRHDLVYGIEAWTSAHPHAAHQLAAVLDRAAEGRFDPDYAAALDDLASMIRSYLPQLDW
jgi:hypothetical protein